MTQLTGVRRKALEIAIPLAITWAGIAMSAQAASPQKCAIVVGKAAKGNPSPVLSRTCSHNGSDRSLKAAAAGTGSAEPRSASMTPAALSTSAEPPAKNLRRVTPDMLSGLLKKAPTGKSEALPPRPEGIGAQAIPPGPYFVQSAHSFRCLDAVPNPPNTNGNKVHLWDCHGRDWQKWYFWNLNSNNYLIANKYHGRILDADTNTICCNGTKIQIWQHIPGNLNQTWWLWTDGLGLYIQTDYPMPTPRLLDADLKTICCNGTKVQLWDPNRNNNQSWAGPPRP